MTWRWVSRVALAIVFLQAGCGGKRKRVDPASVRPQPIGEASCASCGMFVAGQPAPRAQAVHADGERVYFCSIGDLLAYLPEPSSHGALVTVFVEESDPAAEEPLKTDTAERPWIPASEAWFVGPVPRERIMGTPYLVYRRRQDAERIARRFEGAEVLDWKALRDRPLRGSNR